MGKGSGRFQTSAIDQLAPDLRDKCIDLMMSGRKGCDSEVARLAGVSRQAVCEYRKRHFSKAMDLANQIARAQVPADADVATHMAARAALVKDVAGALPTLAVREKRLAAQQDRHDRMALVMAERAVELEHVPGGRSGLLVRQVKQIGSGDNAQMVEEFRVDTGLLSEFREHEKQIAMELGQWQEGSTGTTNNTYVFVNHVPTLEPAPRVVDVEPEK